MSSTRGTIANLLRRTHVYPAAKVAHLWLGKHIRSRNPKLQLEREFFGRFIRPGDLCFDIGANVGDRTAVFLELGARVVCLEPQPSVLGVLRKRFGRNKLVTIVGKGVGAQPGFADLAICDDVTAISTFSETWRTQGRFAGSHRWSRTHRVEITTLDLLIEEFGSPRFCKVDVEGFEQEVFTGLSKRIEFTVFEFAMEFLHEACVCAERLQSLGPTEFNFSLGETMKPLWPRWVSAPDLFTRLEAADDPGLWGDIITHTINGGAQRSNM